MTLIENHTQNDKRLHRHLKALPQSYESLIFAKYVAISDDFDRS